MLLKTKLLKTKVSRLIFFDILNPSLIHSDLRLISRSLFDYCDVREIHQIDQDKFNSFSDTQLKWEDKRIKQMWRFLSLLVEH